MNLESQKLWSLTGFWGLLQSIVWNVNFRGPEVLLFSIWLTGKDKNRTFLGICDPWQILWQMSTQPLADLDPQRWGQNKASHIPCCDTQSGGPALPVFLGDHPKPALANPKSVPALGYGEATSAELPRKKVGKEKGIQRSGQRRRKERAMNQIRNQCNPVVCNSWRSGVNKHPRNYGI